MCLQTSSVRQYQKWNRNGSEIVFNTTIPVTRKIFRDQMVFNGRSERITPDFNTERTCYIK
jgi:hypothetical protein